MIASLIILSCPNQVTWLQLFICSPFPSTFNVWIKLIYAICMDGLCSSCLLQVVGWLVGDFMEIHVFELLWCCEHVFDWWEVIPTVSLAMGYKLASHCNSLIYQKKISTYLCMCLLCELPKNKCVCVGPFEFLLKCLNLQKQGHSVYSDVCLLLMCGLSFSFLLKLMAL